MCAKSDKWRERPPEEPKWNGGDGDVPDVTEWELRRVTGRVLEGGGCWYASFLPRPGGGCRTGGGGWMNMEMLSLEVEAHPFPRSSSSQKSGGF